MFVWGRFAALTALLAGAASVFSGHQVLAQTPTGFQTLPCHDAVLAIDDSLTCSTSSYPSPSDSRLIAHSHHLWGNLEGVTLNATLVMAGHETHMIPYGEDKSSSYIKTYHRVTRERGLGWSAIRTQGNTSYMTFTADNRSCIGFDHAGPMSSGGYDWLLRGFLCLPADQQASFATIQQYLAAMRIGAPARNRNAFGEPVVALATPPNPA
jgi:hypothetical protein